MLIDKLRNYIVELNEERIEDEREKNESETVDNFIKSITITNPRHLVHWNKRSLIVKEINNKNKFIIYSAYPRYQGHFVQGVEAIVLFSDRDEYILQTKLRKFEKLFYIGFAVIIILGNVAAFIAENFFPTVFLFLIPVGCIRVFFQRRNFKKIVTNFLKELP